jgi:hypothetical protein
MSNTVVTIGAPQGSTAVSVSSADIIFVTVSAGFTGQGGGGGGATNISITRTATTVTVVSDTGTDGTIAAADGTNAGVMTSAMKTKLDGIEAGAEVNDTASELLTKMLTVDGPGSGLDADTLDGVHASALVPYTGAASDVNLGEYGAQLGNIEFDNTPTNTPSTDGSIFWDSGDGTLQLQMKGGSVQKIGMQSFARVYNDSGVQLVKGDVVYISGAQGNRIAAKKAQANSEATSKGTLGFVVETIAAGAEGVVITEGPLYNLTTTGLTAGQTLYLSATTAGAYTTTAPQAPDHIVILATVERVHASAGSIYVKISNGYELDELHDVDTTKSKATPVDVDALLLQDSADSSIWKRLTWANLKATAKTYFDTLYAAVVHTHVIGDVTNLQTTLDGKVASNTAITGATKTKITYDAKGLVTDGADATTADIADSSNKRYVTDAQLTVIGNTSGTNTGDQTITLTGDVTGSGTSSFAATIASKAVTYAKIQDVSATSRLLGRKTAGAGNTEELTASEALDFIGSTRGQVLYRGASGWAVLNPGTSGQYLKTGGAGADPSWDSPAGGVSDGDKGDITVSSSGTVWTVDNKAISLAKIQDISTSRILGRVTASTGVTEELTGTQATTLLDTFTSSLKGLAPASGGGTTNFLRADGTWAAPAGGGGANAVTLNQNFNQTGPVNSTTETAIYSYTLPTDLVAGDTLQLNLAGLFKNNSGATRTVDMYFKLGATTIMSHQISLAANAAERTGSMLLNLFVVATNSQKVSVTSWSPDAAPGAMGAIQTGSRFFNSLGYGTATEDLTSAKTLQVTVRFLTASADLYCYSQGATLVKLPKP